MPKALLRFLKFSIIGFGAFLFDILLLYIFVDILSIHYLVATAVAFLIAVSFHYFTSRAVVFRKSTRSLSAGYVRFIAIALAGLLLVTIGMYVLVSLLAFNYLIARVLVGVVVGVWNYTLNLFVNFKVAGSH